MFGLGAPELLLIVFVLLLLFGAKKLPELAQGLGKGIREFKRAMQDTSDDVKGSTDVANKNKPADVSQLTKPAEPRIDPRRKDANNTQG